jgi:arginase
MKKIQLIEVKSEIGAGTRGASLGIEAMKIVANEFGSAFFQTYSSINLPTENKLLLEPVIHTYAKHIRGIYAMLQKVAKVISTTITQHQAFPVVLAGDHSTAAGTIAGIKMAYPDKRLGVIWVDAHADIHSPYTTPSGNMHGMPLAMALGEDNLAQKLNVPDSTSIKYWQKIKNLGGIKPKIVYDDLVYIAVRDTEPPEDYLIKRHKIKNISVQEIRNQGPQQIASQTINYLAHCHLIYVSFDVDSMDPTISKGTGTPVPDGITAHEAEDLLSNLMFHPKVCCLEIAEVNPTLDPDNQTAQHVFQILSSAVNQLNQRF